VQKVELLNFELTERIKKGEQSAFKILFKLYHKPLCHFARVYVKQMDIADEIVQETFIKIWEIRHTLDETLSLKAFLYRCVHNNCINYIRKLQVDNRLSEKYVHEIKYRVQFLELGLDHSYFDELVANELDLKIQKAIDGLPEQCREIFLLSRFNDMNNRQIAEKMSVSVNTVKTQVSRALQKIRTSLKKD
jgi:RNA polymerase sigma-70 factor (family 1)